MLENGNAQTARVCAAQSARNAEEQDLSLMRAGTACFRGAAMVELGRPADGIDCMATGIAQAQSTGSDMFLPHFRSLIAGAQIKCARFGDAQQNLDDALALVGRKGERTYLADLQRLRGQLVLAARLAGPAIDVRHEFRVALDTAREQGATLLALKAAMDLSKVLERDGDVDEAKALVAEARAGLAGLPAARDHG